MDPYALYVIDDEESIREGIEMSMGGDYAVRSFEDAESAIEAMLAAPPAPDVILLDICLPGINGVAALEKIKAIDPCLPVIMITAYEDIDTVIASMKLGAFDYVTKPLRIDILETAVQKAIETIRLRKETLALQEKHIRENMPCMIGESDRIQDMTRFIKRVAQSPDTPIMILGETGTGKEIIAKAIHFRSPHFRGPMVSVNCAAVPVDLVESEIFGYAPGAFSGAVPSGKKGLVEEADGGTLFLDEIGDLGLNSQAKLLRFLENGEFYRVGSPKKTRVKTRIISATNHDIEGMIESGGFRKDLFFRLGVIQVRVPPLNERPKDILLLARYFLNHFSEKFKKECMGISPDAEQALAAHNWTGNVRELKNAIERGVLVGNGRCLKVEDLGIERPGAVKNAPGKETAAGTGAGPPALPPLSTRGMDLAQTLEEIEAYYIHEAYQAAGENSSRAARLLNLNHHTFRYRMKKQR
jgi:DNA-binding NtrC family response regulator